MNISGNTILITGAASGIGLEIAKLFDENNKLILVDKSQDKLEQVASHFKSPATFAADLASEEAVLDLVKYLKVDHPDLNVAILNAATANAYSLYSDDFKSSYPESEINTNYIANVRLSHALQPLLDRHEDSAFVVTTSALAFAPNLDYPTYSVTKAALHSFVLASRLALKRKKSNIKMFELMPPLTDTPLAQALDVPKISPEEVAAWFVKGFKNDVLEIRVGQAEDVYQLFLKSPEEALMAVNGE